MIKNKITKNPNITDKFINELILIAGQNNVLYSELELALYECDAETLDKARPEIVVLPSSTEELQKIIQLAHKFGISFTPRGAGTGLSGGSTCIDGGLSIVLTRMNQILAIDPLEKIAHVQVGVTNLAVSKACQKYNLYFAPDPSSQIASTIGGNIAENAGGAHTLKHGMTNKHIAGLKVILANGQVCNLGSSYNDNLALDLLGVFIGSEGTLGIATEAFLHLLPIPESVETLLSYFPSLTLGGEAVSSIIASGIIPAAMEMIDKLSLTCVEESLSLGLNLKAEALLIIELDGPQHLIQEQKKIIETIIKEKKAFDLSWAKNEKDRALIWKARKSAFGALGRIAPHAYVLDGVIPRSKLSEAIYGIEQIQKKYNLSISNIYHAGDGNLHPALLYDRNNIESVEKVLLAAKEILELCLNLGGTLSGEHGIGIEKLLEMSLAFSAETLESMRQLKKCFDPQGLLNPGKLIPSLKSCGESGKRNLLRFKIASC